MLARRLCLLSTHGGHGGRSHDNPHPNYYLRDADCGHLRMLAGLHVSGRADGLSLCLRHDSPFVEPMGLREAGEKAFTGLPTFVIVKACLVTIIRLRDGLDIRYHRPYRQ